MLDLKQLDKRLAGVDPTLADAVRFVYIDTNLGLEDTRRTLSDRLQAGLTEGALGAFEQDSALSELRQQVNAQRSNEFAPPGITDSEAMTPEGTAALPAVIQALAVDETTGALKYWSRRERHTMGSLTQRDTDGDWTPLVGLMDARLAAGASEWQLARWNHATGVEQWQPFDLGADGTFLKSKGPGVAPEWTDTLPLSLHAWSHTSHHWDATANGGEGAWVASDDTIPTATVNHTGLVPALPTSNATNKFLNGLGNWRALSMADWHLGTANNYDMLRLLPVYGSVDPETGEPTIYGWDWQPFAPDMDDMSVWFGGDSATAEDDPTRMLIARPVSNGDTPETFTYQGETITIADALNKAIVEALPLETPGEKVGWLFWSKTGKLSISNDPVSVMSDYAVAACKVDANGAVATMHWLAGADIDNPGLVPELPAADARTGKFLNANGAWAVPDVAPAAHAATHYSTGTDPLPVIRALYGPAGEQTIWTGAGLAPAADGSTSKYLRADGSWQVPPYTPPYDQFETLGGLIGFMEAGSLDAASEDDPWQILIFEAQEIPASIPTEYVYKVQRVDAISKIFGDIEDEETYWPRFLKKVPDGEDGYKFEFSAICDTEHINLFGSWTASAPIHNAIPYFKVSGSSVSIEQRWFGDSAKRLLCVNGTSGMHTIQGGEDGQVLVHKGTDNLPAFEALPAASISKAGVVGPLPDDEAADTKFLDGLGAWSVPSATLPPVGSVAHQISLVSDVTYDVATRQLRKYTRTLNLDADMRIVSVGAQAGPTLVEQAVSMLGA